MLSPGWTVAWVSGMQVLGQRVERVSVRGSAVVGLSGETSRSKSGRLGGRAGTSWAEAVMGAIRHAA